MAKGRLRPRLVGSFVAVALVGVATLGLLMAALVPGQLSRLVVERQDRAAREAAESLGETYRRGRGWTETDLGRAGRIAATGDGTVSISSDGPAPSPTPTPSHGSGGAGGGHGNGQGPGQDGGASPTSSSSAAGSGSGTPGSSGTGSRSGTGSASSAPRTGVNAAGIAQAQSRTVEVPIVTDGRVVGSLTVEYPADGLPAPERDFASSLRWAIVAASLVAVVVALLVGLFVARRLTRPLEQLTVAARRLGTGDLTTRIRDDQGPGEVGELAETFDQMADSLAREDEVRRALVADVTHELRTPVTVLQASLEELVDGTVEPEVERLSSLHDEVLRLARILQDLQALSAAQAAGLDMHVQPVDLATVAGEAIERLSGPFASAEVEPRVDLEPAVVLGDPSRLDQVVTNLLTNALKFTPAGGEVHVSVSRMNGEARMEVEDTGPGIAPDELDHVFERFWRGGAGRSSSGSGVGLAVVAELVRAHHGHVDVESVPGEGARFFVTLPAA